ncbi:MAG: extensin family protein [Sphingomonadales bacterium]|nr:extensin family protein [Sphingomonadales bacterium]PIX65714.1 MAG: extensin [Sphingomonadales bacterium CG_4_10_14_3_um_filter_58_15]NCO49607.1 extensin family protein [Sphingomonadales bacterium]NCP00277.1 extensin family protein [Sphingomonadales bacterium]NCP26245.1 extensin family protein [Sphingomonadales bacterium]
MNISFRAVLLVIALALVLRGYEWVSRDYRMPWTPLSLAAPIGPFTTRKIGALADDTPRCHQLLEEAAIDYSPLPPVDGGPRCGYDNGVTLAQDQPRDIAYSPAAKTSCPVAVSLVLWEKQIVNAAAREHLGTTVEAITTFGSYSCRRIGGGQSGNYSEHATANAIDIAAFRLADGRTVSVAGHWDADDERSRFLKEVRDGGCEIFATTLSPDYNKAHADHLHFDQARRGGSHYCR